MEYEIWVRKLRELRLSCDLTQAVVARGIQLSRPQYSAIENGLSVVSYHHLYNLAKFYKVSMADIVTMRGLKARPRLPRQKAGKKATKKSNHA